MSPAVPKAALFRRVGYGGEPALLDQELERAGLSRPGKTGISSEKEDAVRRLVAERFLLVCGRGDCQAEAHGGGDGRIVAPAAAQEHCSVCGGSANRRAVAEMVAACRRHGVGRLCVVGGSPNARQELERLVGGALELRLVDGTVARTSQAARADLAWAGLVVVWGSTQLDHKVSTLYHGRNVVALARRSIQELARTVSSKFT